MRAPRQQIGGIRNPSETAEQDQFPGFAVLSARFKPRESGLSTPEIRRVCCSANTGQRLPGTALQRSRIVSRPGSSLTAMWRGGCSASAARAAARTPARRHQAAAAGSRDELRRRTRCVVPSLFCVSRRPSRSARASPTRALRRRPAASKARARRPAVRQQAVPLPVRRGERVRPVHGLGDGRVLGVAGVARGGRGPRGGVGRLRGRRTRISRSTTSRWPATTRRR